MPRFILFATLFSISLTAAPRFPIVVGERLYYEIRVKGIFAGEQITTVSNLERMDGVAVWHVHSITRSTGWVRSLYRLEDTFEAWIDTNTLLPVRARRSLSEGSWTSTFDLRFDAKNKRVSYTPAGAAKPERHDAVDSETVELLSLIYYLRGKTLTPGAGFECFFWDLHHPSRFKVSIHDGRPFQNVFEPGGKDIRTLLVDESFGPRIQIALAPEFGNIPVRVTLPVFRVWKFGTIDVDGVLVSYRTGGR